MPEDSQDTPQGPLPVLLAMLVCDQVITEVGSGKKSIIGVFDQLIVNEFPARSPMTVFARMTDGQGKYEIKIELAHIEDDKIIGKGGGSVNVEDRLLTYDMIFDLPIVIPKKGNYEFRLYANNAYLGRTAVSAVSEE